MKFSTLLSHLFPALFLTFSLFFSLSLCAQSGKRHTLPVLPSLNIDLTGSRQAKEELKPEKVLIDRSNIAILDRVTTPGQTKKKMTKSTAHRLARWTKEPANSLAAKLRPDIATKKILWTPRWGGNYINGTNVEDAALSPDKSIIAFLEKTGETPGPFATRIVLLDTHNWEIVQARDLEEVFARKCVWNGNFLTLLCTGQKSRHTKDAIALYDPVAKKLVSKTFIPFQAGKNFVSNASSWLILTEKHPSKAHLYQVKDKTVKEVKIFEDFSSEVAVTPNASGDKFYFCDRDFLYICRLSDRRINEKIQLPENLSFQVNKLHTLDKGAFLLLPEHSSGAPAGFFKGKTLINLGSSSSGLALPGFTNDSFMTGFSKGGQFAVYHKQSLDRLQLFSVTDARPRTQGTVLFAFTIPHARSVMVLDSRGILFFVYPDRADKRFLKEILTKKIQ
ncbi:MAG: hypothetical protein J6S53_04410 [Lentisphaeria bacterium]|nr:hypothetical protein [Lentisphaeria bacterium]